MSQVIDVTEQGALEDIIADNETVVVDFQALAWCVPCRRFEPHFVAAAEQAPNVKFVTVDIDKAPWAVVEYGVQGVPTVKLYRKGEYVKDLKERTVIKLLSELE